MAGSGIRAYVRISRYVMTYRGKLEDPHYELIYAYSGTRDMSIYRRVKKGCS